MPGESLLFLPGTARHCQSLEESLIVRLHTYKVSKIDPDATGLRHPPTPRPVSGPVSDRNLWHRPVSTRYRHLVDTERCQCGVGHLFGISWCQLGGGHPSSTLGCRLYLVHRERTVRVCQLCLGGSAAPWHERIQDCEQKQCSTDTEPTDRARSYTVVALLSIQQVSNTCLLHNQKSVTLSGDQQLQVTSWSS